MISEPDTSAEVPRAKGTRIATTLNDLLAWAEATLGSKVTTTDYTWPHDTSLVLELIDADGERWFLKHPRDGGRFKRELRAYHGALESFGDRVPRMVGFSDTHRCLLLAAVPGQLARGEEAKSPDLHRQAGALLSRLHRSDWPEPSPELGDYLAKHRASMLEKSEPLLDPADFRFVRDATAALISPAIPLTVPCHRDYWPRNWMVGPDGTLRIIDFGQAQRDLAVRDFVVLSKRMWAGRPDLREAFFEGYGRQFNAHEQAQLDGLITMISVMKVVKAAARGNTPMLARTRQSFARLKSAETSK